MSCVKPKRKCAGSDNDLEIKKVKSDSTEKKKDFINFLSVPSLENIAVLNVATGICKQTIRDAVREHSFENDLVGFLDFICCGGILCDRRFGKLEKSFFKKLSFFPLSNILKTKVDSIKTPVLLQMLKWMRYYGKDIEYTNSVCWTVQGTIDKVQTFEQLVKNDSAQQHVNFLYELACTCCLEDSIPNLWDKLPQPSQKDYEEKMCYYIQYENHLVAYWTSIVKNELSGLLCKIKPYDGENLYDCNKSIYYNMIKLAISEGNSLAVKYFWNKLTAEEIINNLAQWISDSLRRRKDHRTGYQSSNKFSDVLYFLLSQIVCSEKQKDIFKENSEIILTSLFLDWPWQRFLLPTIRTIWISLDEEVYVQLLSAVVDQIQESKTTEELMRQLWLESPMNLKTYFIQYVTNGNRNSTDVIFNLLAVKDVQTIKLIINHANAEEKKQIAFSIVNNEKLFNVIHAGKLWFLDALLGETLSSDIDVHNFKAKIMHKYGNRLCFIWIQEVNYEMVEKFLKWAFTSQDQIDSFKSKDLNKIQITYYKILKGQIHFQLADHFLCWCFNSEQEILEFKKNFAKSKFKVAVEVGSKDWGKFEQFVSWCFTSDQDINVFKLIVFENISDIIRTEISCRYNFKFVDKLISWCCHSAVEIKQFKSRFVLSDTWLKLLDQFASNRKLFNGDHSNWELTQKLIKLFSPFDEEVIINLKERIKSKFNYGGVWDFEPDSRGISFPIEMKHLCLLMENPLYTPPFLYSPLSITIIRDNEDRNSGTSTDKG